MAFGTSGINFGGGYYVPAAALDEAGAADAVEEVDDLATGGKRLTRRVRKRSARFKDKHRHREGDDPNPFQVSFDDPTTASVRESKKGHDFLVMKAGGTVSVTIDDLSHHSFLFRRFLTPHFLEGDEHISISDLEADFLRRTLHFTLAAHDQGLVRILALDTLGRCRGELVISIKDFSPRHSVQFVRVHNGKEDGKLQNATSLGNAQLTALLQDAGKILQRQTGISLFSLGPPVELETTVDLSQGLTEADFRASFAEARHGAAAFTVYLFANFRKPFLGSNETIGAAPLGQFPANGFGVVALSDEATAKGRPEISLAHEICHSLIDPVHFADLGYDANGHYQDTSQTGLMRGGQNSEVLRWRDVNVINPTGLGPGGLAGLMANASLWRNSGS